jgi:NAD(P)H-dependent flavin oxidoreductase YrpB (nitropropane dioxygenase family)
MVGSPKHVQKALEAGVDLICAQGGEGGGHTGDLATSILIPMVVDLCRNAVSPLTKQPVIVVAAGGMFDGRSLAMALALGAQAVWVGTRFVACTEAGASKRHKQAVVGCGPHDTMRSLVYTGRPLRILKNEYAESWENERAAEMKELLAKGVLPIKHDFEAKVTRGLTISDELFASA